MIPKGQKYRVDFPRFGLNAYATRFPSKPEARAISIRINEKQNEVDLGLEQKQKELRYWQDRLAKLTVEAEQAGYVIHASHPWNGTKYQIGDQVQTGQVIVKISKTTDMRVKAWINAIDLPRIKQDLAVTVKFDALPNKEVSGKISQISAGGHDKTNWGNGLYYEIEIELRPESEITNYRDNQISPLTSEAFNPSFDITSGINITGIICEQKCLKPPYLKSIKEIFNGN